MCDEISWVDRAVAVPEPVELHTAYAAVAVAPTASAPTASPTFSRNLISRSGSQVFRRHRRAADQRCEPQVRGLWVCRQISVRIKRFTTVSICLGGGAIVPIVKSGKFERI